MNMFLICVLPVHWTLTHAIYWEKPLPQSGKRPAGTHSEKCRLRVRSEKGGAQRRVTFCSGLTLTWPKVENLLASRSFLHSRTWQLLHSFCFLFLFFSYQGEYLSGRHAGEGRCFNCKVSFWLSVSALSSDRLLCNLSELSVFFHKMSNLIPTTMNDVCEEPVNQRN